MVDVSSEQSFEQFLGSIDLSQETLTELIKQHAAPAIAAREILTKASERLDQLYIAGTDVRDLVLLRSDTMDALLSNLWQLHAPQEQGFGDKISLLAVGGYGRAECVSLFTDL